MSALLRVPHGFIRRHLSTIEKVVVAAGMALVLYPFLAGSSAYPSPWEAVITTAVFLTMLASPPAGYFLAVAVMIYPIYTLSIYLAVLFVAVALLGQRVFINNLGAVLLVLAIPLLAELQIAWVVPILGGLWWGKAGGAWLGALAALWGQVLFGMMGQSPDWMNILGAAPQTGQIAARFTEANSLETLKLIVAPLAPDPTYLLYLMMQVALWALAGGFVGALADRGWFQRRRPWGSILLAAGAGAALCLGHVWLAAWLQVSPDGGLGSWIPTLALNTLVPVAIASALELLRDFFEHPLPGRKGSARANLSAEVVSPPAARQPSLAARLFHLKKSPAQALPDQPGAGGLDEKTYSPLPVPEDLPRRDPKKQRPDDLIKIELD